MIYLLPVFTRVHLWLYFFSYSCHSSIRIIRGKFFSILRYTLFSLFHSILGLFKKVQVSSSGLCKEFAYFTTPSLPVFNRFPQVKHTSNFTTCHSAFDGRSPLRRTKSVSPLCHSVLDTESSSFELLNHLSFNL